MGIRLERRLNDIKYEPSDRQEHNDEVDELDSSLDEKCTASIDLGSKLGVSRVWQNLRC